MPETNDEGPDPRPVAPLTKQEMESPIVLDPLDRTDLEASFPGFANGDEIQWSAVFKLAAPGVENETRLRGVDWSAALATHPVEILVVGDDDELHEVPVEPPTMTVAIQTGATSVTAARDIGRSRLATLVGYLHLRTDLLIGVGRKDRVWEGPVRVLPGDKILQGANNRRLFAQLGEKTVEEIRLRASALSLKQLQQRHQLALEWVTEAYEAQSLPIQFTNLWCAVVVATDSTYSRKDRASTKQLARLERYLRGLPISGTRQDALLASFRTAYAVRNTIVHEGKRDGATVSSLDDLLAAVREFLVIDIGSAPKR